MHLKNYHDTEDVFQEVFLKYILHESAFDNDEHEKAWLIRVSINACKDTLKSYFRRKTNSLDDLTPSQVEISEDQGEILNAVLGLPNKYKDVIYLFYYEGYSAKEIAGLLNKNENTIYTWLSRGREQLRISLGGDLDE